ncbi:hypothetical protein EGR_01248 [Echinococcus granulosus]|uniref:Uncharacterized protein n=1 Tax=Echinococcus granulosus TaxID=6210 RepID=W6UQY2_ECHGR|nr:hypothetical protein EGR_01248 [Echinococcus granulosus]EUB64120.1 hypothetical protein EGR_01248 [Echinococcus granulosus]
MQPDFLSQPSPTALSTHVFAKHPPDHKHTQGATPMCCPREGISVQEYTPGWSAKCMTMWMKWICYELAFIYSITETAFSIPPTSLAMVRGISCHPVTLNADIKGVRV